MTTPRNSSGMSIDARSSGSWITPSISRVSTCGLPTVSSKPSRRIVSTSTASWSSPRPCTSHESGRSVGSTRSDTLPTSSWSSRSLICRAVRRLPSRPASGEVLMPIVSDRLGSSTAITGSGARVLRVGERLADRDLGDPRHRDDVAGGGALGGDAVEGLGHVQLGDPGRRHRPVGPAPGDGLPGADLALVDAADREAAHVARRGQVRHQRLERRALRVRGRRDVVAEHVEQGLQVGPGDVGGE